MITIIKKVSVFVDARWPLGWIFLFTETALIVGFIVSCGDSAGYDSSARKSLRSGAEINQENDREATQQTVGNRTPANNAEHFYVLFSEPEILIKGNRVSAKKHVPQRLFAQHYLLSTHISNGIRGCRVFYDEKWIDGWLKGFVESEVGKDLLRNTSNVLIPELLNKLGKPAYGQGPFASPVIAVSQWRLSRGMPGVDFEALIVTVGVNREGIVNLLAIQTGQEKRNLDGVQPLPCCAYQKLDPDE